MELLSLSPDQINALLAGVVAGLTIKGIEAALNLLAKLAAKTKTKLDDNLVAAVKEAIKAKIKK